MRILEVLGWFLFMVCMLGLVAWACIGVPANAFWPFETATTTTVTSTTTTTSLSLDASYCVHSALEQFRAHHPDGRPPTRAEWRGMVDACWQHNHS